MRKVLKGSIIVLVSFVAFERIINAEYDDDAALARIDRILFRSARMAPGDKVSPTAKNPIDENALESELGDLLEFGKGATKWPMVREDVDETPSYEPSDERESDEEFMEYATEEIETEDTTKHPRKHKTKHAELVNKIRKKLTDKETKITVSLPVAIIAVGSIILATCCCSLYLRNRLVACINTITGRKKKRSKMLAVDAERGRSKPKIRKKSVSSNKRRARSLSQDFVNIATQKSSSTAAAQDVEEESTTGCYRCCKKKKKRGKAKR